METLWLHVRAPFASFSSLRTGTYRDTMPIMPPSAAYGLILNLAGIEMRGSLKKSITPIRSNLPTIKLAFGRVAGNNSEISVLLQNMHSYPIGQTGKERKAKTHGNKYWIEPTYREIIVNLDMMLGVQADSELIFHICQGLNGECARAFYGFPFAGDNNFLFDRIDCLEKPLPTHWFVQVNSNLELEPGAINLTVEIDRNNPSQTKSLLFSATKNAMTFIPDGEWLSMFEKANS
ncbi:MAG: CRISPR-associated protein Cas5 [Xenococcaceae cyanobacterium]